MRYPKQYLSKTCEGCGGIFARKTHITYKQWETTRFCSRTCKGKWQFKGNRHPNWKGGGLNKACQCCSARFFVIAARSARAKFCSSACKIKGQDRGVSSANEKARKSSSYKEWRKGVFQRDNYTCQACGERGGYLQADHIQPFAVFHDLRLDLANGRTLCVACHKLTPTYGKSMSYVKGF